MKLRVAPAFAALAFAALAVAQRGPSLSTADAAKLLDRTVQLIESTQSVVPGLTPAGAPAFESAKQAAVNLKVTPGNSAHVYAFLTAVRAYLAVADSVPKPFPFPDEGLKQFAELRENAGRIEAWFRVLLDQKELQVRSPDRDNLKRYREANQRLSPPAPGKPRVVFYGDSITDAWRLNEYFEGRDFVNRGISGQVTGEMLGRMQADVIALRPKAMIVLAGTNDLARGTALETIQDNLVSIADLAQFHGIKPLFASILPVSDYHKDVNPRFEVTRLRPPAKILEMNRWLRAFCERRKFRYVDYYAVLADGQGFLGADLADDGLHPNPKGYRLMAPAALAAIDAVLKAPAPTPPAGDMSKKRK